jgi:septum formation protein
MRLVLASASPRRAELLKAAGFEFEVRPVDVDERVRPGETPAAYVRRLAEAKAAACVAGPPSVAQVEAGPAICILAADTAVVVDGVIFGKPADDIEARAMLQALSGRAHQVMTGVCVRAADAGNASHSAVETTTVWFATLGREEIDWYLTSGEGRDKAGAYAIQGLAARFIPRIDGSYSNVVGLPIALVHELTTRISVPRFR